MQEVNWILCPICGNKTRDKIREDTILKNFPLFCPKCKSECLIDVEQFHITVISLLRAAGLRTTRLFWPPMTLP